MFLNTIFNLYKPVYIGEDNSKRRVCDSQHCNALLISHQQYKIPSDPLPPPALLATPIFLSCILSAEKIPGGN